MENYDLVVIGAGPAGAATAIEAARLGASVIVFDKAPYGRDKVCGDGLTPRAVGALGELGIDLDDAHRIDGLRMIAGKRVRELPWPETTRFPAHGAVWPRRRLDASLMDAAVEAGATVVWETEAIPTLEGGRVTGVDEKGSRVWPRLVVSPPERQAEWPACSEQSGKRRTFRSGHSLLRRIAAARRPPPRGLSHPARPRRHGRARLRLDVPGRGRHRQHWCRGPVHHEEFQATEPQHACSTATEAWCEDDWELGPNLERPRAWRLPMSTQRRHGRGWVAVGDAAGLVNPMNGEGIDYGLESRHAGCAALRREPETAAERYDPPSPSASTASCAPGAGSRS